MRNISENGNHKCKNAEGLRLKAYICAAGKLTIGYGHRVQEGDLLVCTQEQAEYYFVNDMKRFVAELNHDIPTADKLLNQNQFDALCMFIYNVGVGNFRSSTLLIDLHKGNLADVTAQMKRWVHDDHGKVIEGLVHRRAEEIVLFQTPVSK